MVNGIEEVYYNSPTLHSINSDRLNIYLVLITGKTSVTGAPTIDQLRQDLKNATSVNKGVLYWEQFIDNPIELALYDYIGLPSD